MDARTFFDNVVNLRNCQKNYFATRSREWLLKSKELEAIIDKEIERVQKLLTEKQAQ